MNENELRAWILERPFIKRLLYPANWIRRKIISRRAVISSEDMYANFCKLVVEDPVLNVPEFRGSYVMSAKSDIFKRLITEGKYEPELASICLEFIDAERDVVDVGANIGFYSVLFAKSLDRGRVVAVEPTSNALDRLGRNIQRNEVAHKVTVYKGVLSNCDGTVDVNVIPGKEEYSTIGDMCHSSTTAQHVESVTVSSTTLDSLTAQYSLNIGFIKMDVEGMEHFVLEGASQVMEKHRPVIVSELSNPLLLRNGISSRELVNRIIGRGYCVIDPLMPAVTAGNREYCDILCIPEERSNELRRGGLLKHE